VQDEAPVRRLVREVLARHGYTVLEARGAVEALALARRSTSS
jgi:CheY-like chemotaxis protein